MTSQGLRVLSFRPPLCVGFEDVELALNTLETAFQQHMSKRLRGWRYGQAQSRS
ncbi:GL18116 [Drosophila persimilis]|uniref:GL18116 n=1 Tax=Drosophila persimilis TaxID=7234 RepID=B4HC15_DROPE|nr:GL18116 [Drosophila persimilis]